MVRQFKDQVHNIKYVKGLELKLEALKLENFQNIKTIKEINNTTLHAIDEGKELKAQLFGLQKQLRKIPYDKQIYLLKK